MTVIFSFAQINSQKKNEKKTPWKALSKQHKKKGNLFYIFRNTADTCNACPLLLQS